MDRGPGASGVDVYSDGVYTNIDPAHCRQRFPQPEDRRGGVAGSPRRRTQQVSGGLIRNNLINLKNGEPYFAILLLNTHGQRIQDNVIRDPTPPPVQTLCCTDGIELDAVRDVEINGNTITGLAAALRVSEAYYPVTLPGLSDVQVTHNRFYANAPRDPGVHPVSAEFARRPRQLVGSERRRRLKWRPPGCRQPGQRPVVRAYRLGGRGDNRRRPAHRTPTGSTPQTHSSSGARCPPTSPPIHRSR